jgi:hypothetical protein
MLQKPQCTYCEPPATTPLAWQAQDQNLASSGFCSEGAELTSTDTNMEGFAGSADLEPRQVVVIGNLPGPSAGQTIVLLRGFDIGLQSGIDDIATFQRGSFPGVAEQAQLAMDNAALLKIDGGPHHRWRCG